MGISRSTYYFELKKPDAVTERNAELTEKINVIGIIKIPTYDGENSPLSMLV